MVRTKVIDVFNNMTDEMLIFDMDHTELRNLCNALTLDLHFLDNRPSEDYEC